jgi:hypothetical protein
VTSADDARATFDEICRAGTAAQCRSYFVIFHRLSRVILGRNSIAGGDNLAGNTLQIRSCITKCFFPKTKRVIDHANALRNPKAYTITHELCCQERWGGHHHYLYQAGVLFYSARRDLSQGQIFR